jgi:outer membrane receptor protein involved in Fe transport
MMGVALAAEDAAAQDAPQSSQAAAPSEARNLQGVVVTGSLIRRVDIETASPVVTLDRSTISASGKPTLGDVLQALPNISGKATNPQNNSNGGGAAGPNDEAGNGASRVSLRGLGVERTLVLVNGQRMANPDLNMIPQNMIERTDVLAEGASTVYGSDAIGGVVNFILRRDFSGVQASADSGISSHGDSQRYGLNLTAGKSGDKYSIVGGVDYNKYLPSMNSRRPYTDTVLYLSGGQVVQSGSSSIPNGRVQLPASVAGRYGCKINSSGTTYVTRFQGDGQSLDDYRCYNGNVDNFNYQPQGYLQTAQQRTNGFVLGTYNLTDNVSAFIDAFYNHTQSAGQDASVPLTTSQNFSILASNPINPFGMLLDPDWSTCPPDRYSTVSV